MRTPQGFEWLIILLIVLLLFGGKRLPEMARGLGRSMRILKAETRELTDDDSPPATAEQAEQAEQAEHAEQPNADKTPS